MPYQLSKFRPPVPCELCGVLIPQRTGRRSVRFCSKVCSGKATGGLAGPRQGSDYHAPTETRFWTRVEKTDACWFWTGIRLPLGYGILNTPEGHRRANRIAWELASGELIPPGYVVCHVCDNPPCVRNDDVGIYEANGMIHPRYGHLFLATMKDNSQDMVAKGRARSPLTPEIVRSIRQRVLNGERPGTLAREFNVGAGTISGLLHGRTWQHLR